MFTEAPTPWSIAKEPSLNDDCHFILIQDADGKNLIRMPATPPCMANAEFIVNAANNHDSLLAACRKLIEANPAFRLKKIGFEGSSARQKQEEQITAEDFALAAIAAAEQNC